MEKIDQLIKLHEEIQLDLHKEFVKDKICCVCRTNIIKPLYPPEEIPINPLEQGQGPWNDGLVKVVSAGYGSRHDLESYIIAICDPCLTKLREDKIIEVYRDLKKSITGSDSVARTTNFRKNL